MTDYDFDAIAAGLKLIRKANRAIETRRYGYDNKPGADWHVKADFEGYEGTPTYHGTKGKAALYATEDGTAYEVNVFSYAGKLAHKVTRKTLDAAFKLGQKLANEELPKEAPAPIAPAPIVDEPAEEPYRAEYPVSGTSCTVVVTDDEVRRHCADHGHLTTVKSAEYALPGAHVDRVARLHHIDEHGTKPVDEPAEEPTFKVAADLAPGDEVIPPYEIKTDRVVSVEPVKPLSYYGEWFRVTTENGVFDVGCDYRWRLPVVLTA